MRKLQRCGAEAAPLRFLPGVAGANSTLKDMILKAISRGIEKTLRVEGSFHYSRR